jgi:hypothetical protein
MSNLTQQLPSYPYQQYADDPNVVAFFTAYNNFSQANLDATNALCLPNYQSQFYPLLDWVADSLYGQHRNALPIGTSQLVGPINTYEYNQEQANQYQVLFHGTSFDVSDGVFKSIIQWNNFKGDGYQFTLTWLKRRVKRFMNGNPFVSNTYDISAVFTSAYAVTITVPSSYTYAQIFQAAVSSKAVLMPFQYTFTVVLV